MGAGPKLFGLVRFHCNNNNNNNNYHNKILQTGFLGVYWSDHYITYTLFTNFPEIVPCIMALALLCVLKSPKKKNGNKQQNAYKICINR